MSSVYTPTAVALGNITLPSDLDARTAATINVPLQAIADGVKYLGTNLTLKRVAFTADGTWVVPTGVTSISVSGFGGGGGGGADGTTTTDMWCAGGGGGGGAIQGTIDVAVTAGWTLDVDIAVGGVPGAGGSPAFDGGAGGDTTLKHTGTTLAHFSGAGGGAAPVGGHVASLWEHICRGGSCGGASTLIGLSASNMRYDTSDTMWAVTALIMPVLPAAGGHGCNGSTNRPSEAGNSNLIGGFAGGALGGKGTDSGSYPAGGGGGGGGAGPRGAGAAGGTGTSGGAAGPSGVGADAANNTGAGGGGGATAGQRSSAPGTGGYGGTGGSGYLVISYVDNA